MDERTIEILSRFRNSWTETEEFFRDLARQNPEVKRIEQLLLFIESLKEAEAYRFFRLGNSMDRLVFSRSVTYGLREDQKFIIIDAYDSSFEITLRDGNRNFRSYMIDSLYDPKVLKLLTTLKRTVVD